jgi:phosphatidylserine/phosphatidylglycerophosphate/cardiolipin synthase-like enzyme
MTVYVPCDVVEIKVQVGYGETLTPVEQVLLRAVAAGLTAVGELADVLGIGKRLARDVVYDLWRKGYLTTDQQAGAISISEEIASALRNGGLAQLEGAEVFPETRELMIDMLTGRVQPASGPAAPPNPRLAVPVQQGEITMEDASEASLLAAIQESLDDQRARIDDGSGDRPGSTVIARRPRRVISCRIPPAELRTVSGRRWMPLNVVAAWPEGADRLSVSCVDERFPAERREAASERLTQLAADLPHEQVFQMLRGKAERALIDPPSAAAAIVRLRERAAAAAGIPPGQRRNWHLGLRDDARQLEGLLRARVASEVQAEVISNEAHPAVAEELIGEAAQQIVIAGPWVTYQALMRLRDPLRAAIERGVQVAVLWGIGADESYDQVVDQGARNVLADLARPREGQPRPRVLIPRSSARTHAKMLLVDDHAALVTSRNLLSASGSLTDLGVLIRAPEAGGGQVIRELLGWVRTAVPGYEMSRMIACRPGDFADRAAGAVPGASEPAKGAGPSEPPEARVAAPADTEHTEAEARLWSLNWQQYADEAQTFLATRTLPSARLITDETHREILTRAMHQARSRLVIASHRLNSTVVDERFADDLRYCLERGVEVTVTYGEGDQPGARRLAELHDRFPGTMRVVASQTTHAKALVWDDDAVVGSFNFLSFEGHYRGRGRGRQRSEASLRFTGREIADAVAAAFGASPMPAASVHAGEPAVREPAAETSFRLPQAYIAAQRILARSGGGEQAATVIEEELGDPGTDAWLVLGALDEEEVPPDIVRLAAARCLARFPASATADVTRRWRRWLMLDRWEAGEFVEAALLRFSLADETARPRRPVALLAAAGGGPLAESRLEELFDSNPDPSERAVGIAAGADILLRTGSGQSRDVLELLAALPAGEPPEPGAVDSSDDLWGQFAAKVISYWDSTYAPVPLAQIRAGLGGEQLDLDLRAAWEELQRTLAQGVGMLFDNMNTVRTHRHIFEGPDIVAVHVIIERADVAALRAWRAGFPAPRATTPYVQSASRAVGMTAPVHGAHLRRLVREIDAIAARADALLNIGGDHHHLEPDPSTDRSLAAARVLAEWLGSRWSALAEAVADLEETEGRLVRYLLSHLDELAQWGGTSGRDTP